ncbi:zinc finger protein 91 isoform X1 [Brienomyrus brachyistius]|uniref:zinc finger protein 91 isoform X1 n=1 Tax=Brienomyrus brachyistius TaxID=42636 RepID=UPI0020B20678|nr:zinc finger protein 91 isoform X1 [Brienomyrus brachyistius]
MAAVYTVNGGRLQPDDDGLPSEDQSVSVTSVVLPLLDSTKTIKVEDTSEHEDAIPTDSLSSGDHAAATHVAPLVTIKEERIEDEEYFQIKLGDIGGNSDDKTENKNGSDKDSVNGDWLFRCVDCGEAFEQREAYQEHQHEHIHDGPIVCLDSDSQWHDLLVSEDGGRRTLCCALCGRKFSNSRGFFAHQLKHRTQPLKQEPVTEVGIPVNKPRIFECEDCGKTFSTVGLYLNHQRSHKQASKSVFHQLAHLKKKSFQCPTCGRCYSRASALDAHRRCHEVKLIKSRSSGTEKLSVALEGGEENGDDAGDDKKSRPVCKCPECGKTFRSLSGLNIHQRSCCNSKCPEEKPKEEFNCPDCDKCFLSNASLVCHQRWHVRRAKISSIGQSLSCEECGKVFSSLTFYEKHQRLVHSEETPAKSFLHQVYQLQKKAFECQDCGRRFSRASALQSHQLCHTDVFGDVIDKVYQKPVATPTSLTPPQKLYLCDKEKPENFAIGTLAYSQGAPQLSEMDNLTCKDTKKDEVEGNNRISNTEIIGIIESDDLREKNDHLLVTEPVLAFNCESNKEVHDDFSAPISKTKKSESPLKSKTEVDVELEFESVENEEIADNPCKIKNFECPECGRKFASANAIRCHRMWHKGPMGRAAGHKSWTHKIPSQTCLKKLFKCNDCGKESHSLASHRHHLQQHGDPKPYKSLLFQLAGLQKNSFECEECGMRFSRASALQSHQQHHAKPKRTHKCPHCDKAYSSHGGLYNHRKTCHGEWSNESASTDLKKDVFNPRKTLLGPKVYHCEQCGKGFWSLGAFSQHKQCQCIEVKEKNDLPEPLTSISNHPRTDDKCAVCPVCGKKFRHKGYLKSHMKMHCTAPQKKHKCEICGKSYHMLACFLKHQIVHDSQKNPPPIKSFQYQVEQVKKNMYSCPDCGKRFSRAMALQFHMRSHGYETGYPFSWSKSVAKLKMFQCPLCSDRFSDELVLKDHLNQKHAENQNEVNESREHNQEHEETVSTIESTQKGKNLQSESENSAKEASPVKANSGKYKCRECGRGFSVVGALNFHKRIHLKQHTASDNFGTPVGLEEPQSVEASDKDLYICPECGRSFNTNSALGTHRRWHVDRNFAVTLSTADVPCSDKNNSVVDGPFHCSRCSKGFSYFCVLRRHQMNYCGYEGQTQTDASTDLDQGPNNKPSTSSELTCPKCDLTFNRSSLLTSHYQTYHAKNFTCNQCNVCFFSAEALQKHESQFHNGTEIPEKSVAPTLKRPKFLVSRKRYECLECSKRFFKIRGLRAHRWQMHHGSRKSVGSFRTSLKPFPCTGCEKRYSSQGALYNHRKICLVAKRKLKQKKAVMIDPILPHCFSQPYGKCLFKCHKCGKAFPSVDRLEAHNNVAKSRPHCCALCCRGYWTETQLQQHLTWHDEVRLRLPAELRYRLSTCAQAARVLSLSNQKQSADLLPSKPVDSHLLEDHKCLHCGDVFPTADALKHHQTSHNDLYPCSLCPRTFSQIQELVDHHQECMSEDRMRTAEEKELVLKDPLRASNELSCIECGITFSQEVELHQHYIEHARGEY